jgi:hypothetical protein
VAGYDGGSKSGDYSVFKIIRAWNEDEANWTNASNGRPWTNKGGDYVSKIIAKVTRLQSEGNGWMSFNVLTTVQEFVRDSAVNFGFLLVNTKGNQEITCLSSENAKTDQRPKLTIAYAETASAVRSPSAVALRRGNAAVTTERRGFILVGNNGNAAVEVAVSRPDGKRVACGRIAAGERRRLPASGSGMRIVTITDGSGSRTVTALVQ